MVRLAERPPEPIGILGTDALPKTPLTSGLGVLDSPILRGDRDAAERRRAKLEAADAQTRARIRALDSKDAQTLRDGIGAGRSLLDAWRDGAIAGVGAFRSRLVSDQGSVLPALVGNLLWAATAVEAVPAKVFLSFFGATLGTLGSIPPSYDAVIGPVTGDVAKRINDLHDDMLNRMDVLTFPVLSRRGFAKFAELDPPHQLAFLWQELFRVASDGRYIEPTKAFVLANLQAADQDASDKLQLYQRAWNASLRQAGVDFQGVRYVFDQSVWAQYVSEPVWVWLGPISPSLLVFRGPGDPNPAIHNRRAAAALRLAIERRWPTPSA